MDFKSTRVASLVPILISAATGTQAFAWDGNEVVCTGRSTVSHHRIRMTVSRIDRRLFMVATDLSDGPRHSKAIYYADQALRTQNSSGLRSYTDVSVNVSSDRRLALHVSQQGGRGTATFWNYSAKMMDQVIGRCNVAYLNCSVDHPNQHPGYATRVSSIDIYRSSSRGGGRLEVMRGSRLATYRIRDMERTRTALTASSSSGEEHVDLGVNASTGSIAGDITLEEDFAYRVSCTEAP